MRDEELSPHLISHLSSCQEVEGHFLIPCSKQARFGPTSPLRLPKLQHPLGLFLLDREMPREQQQLWCCASLPRSRYYGPGIACFLDSNSMTFKKFLCLFVSRFVCLTAFFKKIIWISSYFQWEIWLELSSLPLLK